MKNRTILLVSIATVLTVLVFVIARYRFMVGAAFINVGYFFQDGGDLIDRDDARPEELLTQLLARNSLSSSVRKVFPRSHHHPLVAVVACMDGRLHTEEILGDTRGLYYVIRTAGSILELPEIEMLELAVVNGVKLILLTTHSDCTAEKVANDLRQRSIFPNLSSAVDARDERFREFLLRPIIVDKMRRGELLVHKLNIDTLEGAELG